MSSLARLQRSFHDHLLDAPSDIAAHIRPGGRIDPAKRLAIYHNAYRVRLIENLADSFEKTLAYLGDTQFDTAALACIDAHPPTARSLRDYGQAFPDVLARGFPHDPDIAELARMDWAMRQAFDAADAVPLTVADLAAVTPEAWETLGFEAVPSASLIPVAYNTPAIWAALDREETPPAATPLAAPAWLLVWRRGWQPHFRTLEPDEAAPLDALLQGAYFADACLAEAGPSEISLDEISLGGMSLGGMSPTETAPAETDPARIAVWLAAWLRDGVFSGLREGESRAG